MGNFFAFFESFQPVSTLKLLLAACFECLRPLQSRWQMLEIKHCWGQLGMCWELSLSVIQDVLRTMTCTDDLRTPKISMIFVIFGPTPGLIYLLSTANISHMYLKRRTIYHQHVTHNNNEMCEALVEMASLAENSQEKKPYQHWDSNP